jgi:hypothetical protein
VEVAGLIGTLSYLIGLFVCPVPIICSGIAVLAALVAAAVSTRIGAAMSLGMMASAIVWA